MIGYLRAGGDRRAAALRRFALSITVFTVAGHTVLGFEQSYLHPLVAVLTACGAELLLERAEAWAARRPPRYAGGLLPLTDFLLPDYIAGLAIGMLLYPNQRLTPIAFAAVVCVASKYLVRVNVRGKPRHVLNPSNVGIAVTLALFPSVGISPPYHFTSHLTGALDVVVPLAVLASGLFLNWRLTGKMPLIAAWIGGFTAQAVARSVFLDASLAGALAPMTGLAFALFTVYMITDPGTTPMAARGQMAFGLALATAYGVLVSLHVVFGLFFALLAVSSLRGLSLAAFNAVRAERAEERRAVLAPAEAA